MGLAGTDSYRYHSCARDCPKDMSFLYKSFFLLWQSLHIVLSVQEVTNAELEVQESTCLCFSSTRFKDLDHQHFHMI